MTKQNDAIDILECLEFNAKHGGDAVACRYFDKAAKEIRALRAKQNDAGWMPIETAPQDMTPILLWANRYGWEHKGFSRVTGFWDGYGWSIYGCAGGEPKPGYREQQRLDSCNPTHWMPLPAPPQLESTDQ